MAKGKHRSGGNDPQPAASIRDHWIDAHGVQLFCERLGEGHALVLVHPPLADRRIWDEQFASFATRHQVIRYDLSAHGQSPRSAAHRSDTRDLYHLLRRLGIERAYLLGSDMAALVCLHLTLQHPEMVDGLILVSTPYVDGLKGSYLRACGGLLYNVRHVPSLVRMVVAAIRHRDPRAMVPMAMRWWATKSNPAGREHLRQILLDNADRVFNMPPPLDRLHPPAAERLSEIHLPTLIVTGRRDGDFRAVAEALAKRIPNSAWVTIRDAGHYVNMEQPEEFNRVVLEFLKRCEQRESARRNPHADGTGSIQAP